MAQKHSLPTCYPPTSRHPRQVNHICMSSHKCVLKPCGETASGCQRMPIAKVCATCKWRGRKGSIGKWFSRFSYSGEWVLTFIHNLPAFLHITAPHSYQWADGIRTAPSLMTRHQWTLHRQGSGIEIMLTSILSTRPSKIHLVVGIICQYKYSNGLSYLSKYSITMYVSRIILGSTMWSKLFFEDWIDIRKIARYVMG